LHNLLDKLIAYVEDEGGNFVHPYITTVEHYDVVNLCYGRQEIQELKGRVSDAHTWVVCNVIDKIMFLVVKQCILNQTRKYWFCFMP